MAIQDLTTERIREIGATYGGDSALRLTGRVGTTAKRVAVFVISLLLFAALSLILSAVSTIPFGINVFPYFHLVWLAFWAFLSIICLPAFLVSVPKLTGLVLTSYFGGVLHTLGPGLHIKYPWEHYSQDDFIDIRAISIEKPSRFIVQGGTSADPSGAVGVTFKWTVQYGPYLPLLPLYVRMEEKAIADGFAEVVENALSESIFSVPVGDLLKKDTVDSLQEDLTHAFLGEDINGHPIRGSRDTLGNTLEERFGLKVELNTLGPPNFDKDYTEALAATVLRGIVTNDAREMAEQLEIPEEKALQMIMILNKEAVDQRIFTLQADERVAALAPVMMRALRDAGDAGRGIQAGRRGRR